MYMNIPYCKGDKFKNIKVETLVVYATIETKFQSDKNLPKTPRQKPAKNPLKICLGFVGSPQRFNKTLTQKS